MKPEQLKVIAEGMGYRANIIEAYDIHSQPDHVAILKNNDEPFGSTIEYNPLTNNDQMVEIMEKLKLDLSWFSASSVWVLFDKFGDQVAEGKTINEAVCNAAYEYFKR